MLIAPGQSPNWAGLGLEEVGIVAGLLHCGSTVQSAADMVLPFPTIAQVLTPAFRDAVDAMD